MLVSLQSRTASLGDVRQVILQSCLLIAVRVGGAGLLACRSNARTLLDSLAPLVGARAGDGHS